MTKKEIKFEVALKRLEDIVTKLENEEVDLDESLKLFEEGSELVQFCTNELNRVKKKIELLVKKGNKIVAEPFVTDEEPIDEQF